MKPESLTHAVTQPQPLAWALASGHCPVINSDTRPGLEHVGRLIGIHASGRIIRRGWVHEPEMQNFVAALRATAPQAISLTPAECTTGALIGVARLVGVVRRDKWGNFRRMRGAAFDEPLGLPLNRQIEPWWRGPWGWLLEEAVLLPEPIPMRGAGGLWRIPRVVFGAESNPASAALTQWKKARGA